MMCVMGGLADCSVMNVCRKWLNSRRICFAIDVEQCDLLLVALMGPDGVLCTLVSERISNHLKWDKLLCALIYINCEVLKTLTLDIRHLRKTDPELHFIPSRCKKAEQYHNLLFYNESLQIIIIY